MNLAIWDIESSSASTDFGSIIEIGGVLVDEIKVQNAPDQGIVHWDMLTRESLEIAAGMYIYHVESTVTGDSKLGKFAVIK